MTVSPNTLFIIVLRYLAPLDDIIAIRPQHVDFLAKHYETGTFLVSGPQKPRTGGIIMAQGPSREAILAILEQDPFYSQKVAEYQIFEFMPTLCTGAFKDLIDLHVV